MRTKDTILLEQAYDSVYNRVLNESIGQEEANNLIMRFNMLPGDRKQQAFEKLKGLVGKEVSLSRVTGHKQSSGYGREDGSATVPGSGGSVAHTKFELESGEFASGIVQSIKVSQGEEDYTKNGNLILTIKDTDYNVNQGTTVTVKFLEDSPQEIHAKAGQSFRTPSDADTAANIARLGQLHKISPYNRR
jgi:hypothetical protein